MQWDKVASIKPVGKAAVYNMEVEKYHNYTIGSGLVLHNCDAVRYYASTIIRRMPGG